MDTQDHLGRGVAMSAGHLTVAMRVELGRLLAASRGDKRKALAAGLSELHTRKILHAKEATELAAIMENVLRRAGRTRPEAGPPGQHLLPGAECRLRFQPCGSGHCQCHQLTHLAV